MTASFSMSTLQARLPVLALTALAFAIRLMYLLHSHPFFDEFTTILAAQRILERGLPILPSTLFYEHGLIFSYLDVPFVALAGSPPNFAVPRLPSLIFGTLAVPLLYQIGRRWFSPGIGLLAAILLALSPEGMVWGGRARMYALAQLLVLLVFFLGYQGSYGRGRARLRWLALLTLLVTLLTQFGAVIFVPPLVIGMTIVKAWSTPSSQPAQPGRSLLARLWAYSPLTLSEGAALTGIVGLAILVKRLGQPRGLPALDETMVTNPLAALWQTIAYQVKITLDLGSAIRFLGRQFGIPHHLWLGSLALLGLFAFLLLLARNREYARRNLPYLFLWVSFGLVLLEMMTLLQPFRRNPRYLFMGFPLFYLIAAGGAGQLWALARWPNRPRLLTPLSAGLALLLLILAFQHGRGWWQDLVIAYHTPEPAYEEAFTYVANRRHPGDALLTINTSAAALYFDQPGYFAMQTDADQFLLYQENGPVDRWLGYPWLGTTEELNRLLNRTPQVWFVIDTRRLPDFYRGDWLALLKTQMDLVWDEDEALVYRTRPDRIPLPDDPTHLINANLDHQLKLIGLADRLVPPTADEGGTYNLTLFWVVQQEIAVDYTTFIHIRDANGERVAQRDSQPLGGDYPTSQWRTGETVIDPYRIDLPAGLPPGRYTVWAGMYQLETLTRLPVVDDASGENAIYLASFVIGEAVEPATE